MLRMGTFAGWWNGTPTVYHAIDGGGAGKVGTNDECGRGQSGKGAPIHPGEILEDEFLQPTDITQYRLAKSISMDARRVHSIVNGERDISTEAALLFSRFFGNSAGFWMGLQSQYDLEAAEDRMRERLSEVVAHSASRTVGLGSGKLGARLVAQW